jgi:hypothetical protein
MSYNYRTIEFLIFLVGEFFTEPPLVLMAQFEAPSVPVS